MTRTCRIVLGLFAALWLAALGLLAIGTWGSDPDPLAGVFLVPLGLPWNLVVGGAFWAILCPSINLALLALLCRWLSRP